MGFLYVFAWPLILIALAVGVAVLIWASLAVGKIKDSKEKGKRPR